MQNLVIKDFKQRQKFVKSELRIQLLKAISNESNTLLLDGIKANFILNKHFGTKSGIKVVNRCIGTAGSHSVLSVFGLSGMQLKEFASKGFLPGVKKRNG